MRLFLLVVLFSLLIFPIFAQYESDTVPITAANVHQLQSIAQIDFADLDAEFDTGWFDMSSNGAVYIGITANQETYVFPSFFHSAAGHIGDIGYGFGGHRYRYAGINPLSGFGLDAFVESEHNNLFYATLYSVDNQYQVAIDLQRGDEREMAIHSLPVRGIPLDIWAVCKSIPGFIIGCLTLVEVQIEDSSEYVLVEFSDTHAEPVIRSYAPAQDPDAIVRIGRIPPPYTVTSSREGIVKLWNIQTGQVVYEVDNGTGEAAVFGAINQAATHLVWRDSRNEVLYLLNFETGENRYLADLDGQYAQWYFLSNDSSVAIAVNLGFEPNIVAWDTDTGEQTIVGEYRQCNRPQPDMARLSADGTTLVIGCDTGLDIWRVVAGE